MHHVRVAYSLPRQAPTHTNPFPCASLVTPFILNSKTSEVGVNGHALIARVLVCVGTPFF